MRHDPLPEEGCCKYPDELFQSHQEAGTECGCLPISSVNNPPLIKAHVPRRRTNQARHGEFLHVFTHIKANQLDPMAEASCFANSVLPTPVGPANKKAPIGLSVLPSTAS